MRAVILNVVCKINGCSPMNCVLNDANDVRIVVRGAAFVSGLEVKDLSGSAQEACTGTQNVAILIPCAKHQRFGLRNIEGLAVKLLTAEQKMIGNALCNGVRRHEIPHDLLLVSAPGEVAVGTYDGTEGLGFVCRVQRDKAHFAKENAVADLLHQCVVLKFS